MDRITRLRIFVSLAETLSFSQTARMMRLARSSVSKAMNDLEVELATRLLDRTTRSVALTRDGAAFLDRCLNVIDAFDDTHAMFSAAESRPSGLVRASVPTLVGRCFIAPALPDFFAKYPDVQLELRVSHREGDLVREGLDCVLRTGDKDDTEFISRKVADLPLITCASPAYLARYGVPRSLSDLDHHVAVGYKLPFTKQAWTFGGAVAADKSTLEDRAFVFATNADMYVAFCEAGLGLIQVPPTAIADALADGRLVEVLPHIPGGTIPMAVVYAHRRNLTPRVKAFVDWMSDLMRNVTTQGAAVPRPRQHTPS